MVDQRSGGKALTGHLDLVYPTEYVKAADLQGKDVTVVISHAVMEDLVMAGGKRDRKACLHLRNPKTGKPLSKRWVVGKTVLRQIGDATGEKLIQNWSGKTITMFPTTCRAAKGEVMECIRVRARVNQRADEPTDDMMAVPIPKPDFADEAADDAPPAAPAAPPAKPEPPEPGSDG